MSGFTEIEVGAVKIKHHSTSSLVEMTITRDEEVLWGKFAKVPETIWFDYRIFSDLITLVCDNFIPDTPDPQKPPRPPEPPKDRIIQEGGPVRKPDNYME